MTGHALVKYPFTLVKTIPFLSEIYLSAGAAAVTIHGRTWSDRYTKLADWYDIAEVRYL